MKTPDMKYVPIETLIKLLEDEHSPVWFRILILVMVNGGGLGEKVYFAPGELEKRFKVSRTTIHKAVTKLKAAGAIDSRSTTTVISLIQ